MPRKMLSVEIKLILKEVSCPGILHIADRNLVFIRVALIGQSIKTKPLFATFPLKFNQRLKFKREFTNAKSLDTVIEILEDEDLTIELCQYNEDYDDGRILASFTQSSREFLFPAPTLLSESNPSREVLLTRCCHFISSKALDPKLTFTTKTTVKEVDGMERFTRSKTPKSKAKAKINKSSSSETDEEIIITTSKKNHCNNRKESLSNRHCFCECPHKRDSTMQLYSSGNKFDENTKKIPYKPPFKTGKAPHDLISKRQFDFDLSPHNDKKKITQRSSNEASKYCSACETPHPDCVVCDSFIKVYGKDFVQHRFEKPKSKKTPTASIQQQFLEAPVSPRISSTPYHVPLVRARPPIDLSPEMVHRPQKPVLIHSAPPKQRIHRRPNRRDSSNVTAGKEMHRSKSVDDRIRHLLKKNQSSLCYDQLDSSSNSEDDFETTHDDFMPVQDIRRSLQLCDDSTDELPNRSVVVPLGDGDYWLSTQGQYSHRSHRQIFNDSLGSIYREMYRTTRDRQ